MADVVNRTTLEYRESVHTPDFDPAQWLINPVLPFCERKYWQIDGDLLSEMNAGEKAAVDAAEFEAAKTAKLEELAGVAVTKTVEERPDYQLAMEQVALAATPAELAAIALPKG